MTSDEQILKSIAFQPKIETFEYAKKGGSSRSFLMFDDAQKGRCVLCKYSDEKAENFLYADIAIFLKNCGIPTPEIYFHDKQNRLLVMQNMGTLDLLDFCKNKSENEVEKIYKSTLYFVALLHSKASAEFFKKPIELMPKFDDALYDWEQNYFFENLVKNRLKLDVERPKDEWAELSRKIQGVGECLIHRDLQSQNVMVQNETQSVGFIDFQGMRLGSFWYDLGSLLFDPYASLNPKLRSSLYNYYCEIRGLDATSNAEIFCKSSAQRLMQALGAYAFLADKKGKTEYLNYIPQALDNLIFCAELAKLPKTLEIAKLAKCHIRK